MIIKIVNDKQMLQAAYAIRKSVFVDEQHVPSNLEIDEFEDVCSHFLVFSEDGNAIATSRMRIKDNKVKFERICVLKEYRGLKVGEQLMQFMEKEVFKLGHKEIILEAQTQALNFYKKMGYQVNSDSFFNCGIEHYKMTKYLNQ